MTLPINMPKATSNYQICPKCVMDSTDPGITFNGDQPCSSCVAWQSNVGRHWFPNDEGARRMALAVKVVREWGKDKEYDCVLGISGGVDSSFLCLWAKEVGLRPLLVHVDAGWNTELAQQNIEKLVEITGFDLFTHVLDWDCIKEGQRALLKSGLANQDAVQDHAFFAALYGQAVKHGIRWVINGYNVASEFVGAFSLQHNAMDGSVLKDVFKRHANDDIEGYPILSAWEYLIKFPILKGMRVLCPLNWMPYSRHKAISHLESRGWKYYGGKHHESRFTRYFQCKYLPQRYGYDKRRSHLSSLILSGEITRIAALEELDQPACSAEILREDEGYVKKKLGFSDIEFDEALAAPQTTLSDFSNNQGLMRQTRRALNLLDRMRGGIYEMTTRG